MLSPEDIKVIADLMKENLKPINERLDKIEERLDIIEENTEITRSATNDLIEWVDYNFRDEYPFPVDKKKAI